MIISHMINVIAIGSTDVSIVARECESLGVDWKEVLFYRLQRALEEWDVLGLVESLKRLQLGKPRPQTSL